MAAGKDHRRRQAGQAAVETALVLPVVVLFGLVVLQAGLVAKDYLLVHHAAREAARAGAVDPGGPMVRSAAVAAGGLEPGRMSVLWPGSGATGERATATVRYRSPTRVPLVGRLVGDVTLSASVTVRIE
jgi:hypothetical protein